MVLARACSLKMLGLLNLMAEPRHNPPACPDMSRGSPMDAAASRQVSAIPGKRATSGNRFGAEGNLCFGEAYDIGDGPQIRSMQRRHLVAGIGNI